MLQSKLSAVRQKHVTVSFCTGLVAAVGALVLGLGIGMLLDWWLDLPWVLRAIFLALDLALLVVIVLHFIISPIVFGPDDEAIALRVEDAEPSLASRLIASVQLSRSGAVPAGASSSMVKAMVTQTEAMSRELDFGRVVPTDRLTKLAIGAALAVLLGLCGFAWGYNTSVSTDLLRRALLGNVDVPRKTRIRMGEDADRIVPRGDTVILGAHAAGSIPDKGEVEVRFESGRKQFFALDRDAKDTIAPFFTRDLQNVQDSFTYRIHLGDARSPWHTVSVLSRPITTNIDVRQVYPPYTRMGTITRSLGDLQILAGSHLLLSVTSNNPCNSTSKNQGRNSFVHLVGSQADVPMTLDAHNPHLLTADVEVSDTVTGFAIHLVDSNGLASADDAANYRIDVIQDKDPVVKINFPINREELATKIAHEVIAFDANDDFGITKLSLKYKVDDGPEQTVPLQILDPKHAHNRYDWNLGKISPASTTQPSLEGSSIEYWIEAVDNNNVRKSGPGVGTSEHYTLRIVSEEVKRAEIAARMAGLGEALRNGIDDQQNLSDSLGEFVTERKTSP
jgi:hypothetical protein